MNGVILCSMPMRNYITTFLLDFFVRLFFKVVFRSIFDVFFSHDILEAFL